MERLRIIDSHTGGEPTRAVVQGLPDLGDGSISDLLKTFERDFDRYRTAIIGEPRSPNFAVGAYLLPSSIADHGVIFFNNASYLGMCGHGTIGLVATLAHLGLLEIGDVSFETPAGVVKARLNADGTASFENVPSYRFAKDVALADLEIAGDVAYGGNWFFITGEAPSESNRDLVGLSTRAKTILAALQSLGIRGADGAEIDHIEIVGPSTKANVRNFVLCPGGEYDRSPCGTGTSAKLACLFEDGKLQEGEAYRVESITGSIFSGSVRRDGAHLRPTITGQAFVNGDGELLIDPNDPFGWGIRP